MRRLLVPTFLLCRMWVGCFRKVRPSCSIFYPGYTHCFLDFGFCLFHLLNAVSVRLYLLDSSFYIGQKNCIHYHNCSLPQIDNWMTGPNKLRMILCRGSRISNPFCCDKLKSGTPAIVRFSGFLPPADTPYHLPRWRLCWTSNSPHDFPMYFSRKSILTKGKKPLYAASKVLNSCGSATAVVARCWVHSTNKTSAIFRSVKSHGFRRAYSTSKSGAESASSGPAAGLPFYRM